VQGYPPVPPPGPGGRRPRNGLGAVTFVVVVLGALLAVFPASAPFGLLLCLVAIVPAIVAFRRTRRGTATNRRRSAAAVALAPAFVVVAVVVGAATTPTTGTVGRAEDGESVGVAPVGSHGIAAVAPAGPLGAAAVGPAAPEGAVAVGPAASGPVDPQAASVTGRAAPAQAGPPRQAPRAQTARQAVPAAPRPAVAPKPAAKPAPPPEPSSAACSEATHYVNSSGNCVLRPVVAAVAPSGASARCKDGTYSSSQHRSGTCSGHKGVQEWLKDLPA
jgi:Protein of unknown function (DUF3761)